MQQTANDIAFIYTTLPSAEAASELGKELVGRKLAACVNIFPEITSIYEWQGELQSDTETAMIIKTRREIVNTAIEAARILHPYDTPALLILPITGGNESYLSWVMSQTETN